jgi:hypothetical protein
MGAASCRSAPEPGQKTRRKERVWLIVRDEFPAVPRRVALQQSLPPLHQPPSGGLRALPLSKNCSLGA